MRLRRALGTWLTAFLSSLIPFLPASASGEAVTCGTVISADTTLTADLLDCRVSGITVAASDVTLDLNGHVIEGQGSGNGLVVPRGISRVVIRNGVIQRFGNGIFTDNAHATTITGLAFKHNGLGVDIGITDDPPNIDNRITANRFVDNHDAIADFGIRTTIESNVIVRTTNEGFERPPHYPLWGHIVLRGDNALVRHNAISVVPGTQAYGIHVERPATVRDNVVSGFYDGIVVDAAPGSTLERNLVFRNADDGIDVNTPEAMLTGNVAHPNGDLGIEADTFGPVGVTDGGANQAFSNGDQRECVGVTCYGSPAS